MKINKVKIKPLDVYVVETSKGTCLVSFLDGNDDFCDIIIGYYDDFIWWSDYLQNLDYIEETFRIANEEEVGLYIRKHPFYHSLIKVFSLYDNKIPDFCNSNTRRMFNWFMKNSVKTDVPAFVYDKRRKEFDAYIKKCEELKK